LSRDSQDRAAGQPPASFLPTADDFLSEDDPTAKAVFLVLEWVRTVLDRTPVDRDSYVVALLSIVQLVKLFLGAETAVKLLRLPMALADLNSGRVAEFLESGPKSQGDASEIWAQRVYLALALECLMRCGQKKDEAAKEIARSAHLDGLITERRNLKSPWRGCDHLARQSQS
jgi:hypothetical protein